MPATATASAAVRTRLAQNTVAPSDPVRMIAPDAWQASGVPLLRDPRGLITRLHDLHRPKPGTAIVAVLDAEGRPVASASFAIDDGTGPVDGWECRNTILAQLRMIVADDLRRPTPTRTTVLLLCREGGRAWEPDDGRWMWGLRDACALHGLRCGATVVLAENGWQVVGDGRNGRTPGSVTRPPRAPAARRPNASPSARGRRARSARGTPGPHVRPVEIPHVPQRADQPGVAVAAAGGFSDSHSPPPRPAVVRLIPAQSPRVGGVPAADSLALTVRA